MFDPFAVGGERGHFVPYDVSWLSAIDNRHCADGCEVSWSGEGPCWNCGSENYHRGSVLGYCREGECRTTLFIGIGDPT